jgi:hypothetical protein
MSRWTGPVVTYVQFQTIEHDTHSPLTCIAMCLRRRGSHSRLVRAAVKPDFGIRSPIWSPSWLSAPHSCSFQRARKSDIRGANRARSFPASDGLLRFRTKHPSSSLSPLHSVYPRVTGRYQHAPLSRLRTISQSLSSAPPRSHPGSFNYASLCVPTQNAKLFFKLVGYRLRFIVVARLSA